MYERSRNHKEKQRAWPSQREKVDAPLLYRDSLTVLTAVVVGAREKQQQPYEEVKLVERINTINSIAPRALPYMLQNLPHGEQRTGIFCGKQNHAVTSSRTRTHTHKTTSRSTVRDFHKGKTLEHVYCAVEAARDKKGK